MSMGIHRDISFWIELNGNRRMSAWNILNPAEKRKNGLILKYVVHLSRNKHIMHGIEHLTLNVNAAKQMCRFQ